MEHQQAQQQQQYLTLEGLEDSNARAVFVKLINVLLTVLQVRGRALRDGMLCVSGTPALPVSVTLTKRLLHVLLC